MANARAMSKSLVGQTTGHLTKNDVDRNANGRHPQWTAFRNGGAPNSDWPSRPFWTLSNTDKADSTR